MRLPFFFLLFFISALVNAQDWKTLNDIKAPDKDYENIAVVPLHSDDLATSMVIFIRKEVPLHKHEYHTEHVTVISGKGMMKLGNDEFVIKKGDLIIIPKGTPHAVKVLGKKPLKVLSVQAPKFEGKDRVKLE